MVGPGVSILIACGHSAESLRATLQALGELDYRGWVDVTVMDDGGYEGREAAVQAVSCACPIRYLRLPGVSRAAAWNIASAGTQSEFLAFLDDDCIPPADWLSALTAPLDEWNVGIVGGPDRVPKSAPVFERCLEYVLTSFIGTLGMRKGSNLFAKYYPRPWNMAVRVEAFRRVGGFDPSVREAPEAVLANRIERMGFATAYRQGAMVWHQRETDLRRFLRRDLLLSMERGAGMSLPGVRKVYGRVLLFMLGVLMLILSTDVSPSAVLATLSAAYGSVLVLSGIHAAIIYQLPIALAYVPVLLALHHTAHLAGYIWGRLSRRFHKE